MGSKRSNVAYRYGKDLRQMLDNGRLLICGLCGQRIYRTDELSVDHVVSIANGGVDRRSNMRASHKECNQKWGAKQKAALSKEKEENRE